MDITDPSPRRPRAESIVPMINVVFLLLIFFLMTSQLAPPEPFEVETPNAADGSEAQAELILYIDGTGAMHFDDTSGEAAIAALAAQMGEADVALLRADAALEAKTLANILQQLGAAGVAQVEIAVIPQ